MESPEERLARLEDLCEFLLASTVQLARLGKENNDTLYDKMFKEASEKRGQIGGVIQRRKEEESGKAK